MKLKNKKSIEWITFLNSFCHIFGDCCLHPLSLFVLRLLFHCLAFYFAAVGVELFHHRNVPNVETGKTHFTQLLLTRSLHRIIWKERNTNIKLKKAVILVYDLFVVQHFSYYFCLSPFLSSVPFLPMNMFEMDLNFFLKRLIKASMILSCI